MLEMTLLFTFIKRKQKADFQAEFNKFTYKKRISTEELLNVDKILYLERVILPRTNHVKRDKNFTEVLSFEVNSEYIL